ncbi:hypothetical protein ACTAZI_15580 [Legionella bozemanae]|uniref:hypothetical protein n=1 Tax=Legionella bozemanae TaxID=447 RepID=UPI003EECE10F
MVNKKYTIYSAIDPDIPKEVSARERKEYLKCKFWKYSQQEAWIFFYCYFPPSACPSLCRLLLVLSGRLFKSKYFDEAIKTARNLSAQYCHGTLDINSIEDSEYKKIISALDDTYPQFGLLDDIILWATDKKLITNVRANSLRKKIELTRGDILNHENISEPVLLATLKRLIENPIRTPILYQDARKLLFPAHTLLDELKDQSEYLLNNEYFYFKVKPLIKYLMQKDYLSEQLTKEFKSLKIESIKENQTIYNGCFNSLQDLIKKGASRDSLLQEALNGKPLYWQYPINCQCKKDIDNYCICNEGVRWEESFEWIKHPIVEAKRFKAFGRLKINHSNDNGLGAYFGGLTVEMLRYHQLPQTTLNYFRIDLVPTQEEIDYSRQPYIKVLKDELMTVIADDRIGFLDDISLKDTTQTIPQEIETKIHPSLKPNKRETVRRSKEPNRLQLLIQEYYQNLDNKIPEFIWKSMRKDKERYIWIEYFPPWKEDRSTAIKWGTRQKNGRSFTKASFENYVSKLNTGKISLHPEKYSDIYEDEKM